MSSSGCAACADSHELGFEFTFAFQPIIEWSSGRVLAYEALVRGLDGSGAGAILSRVTPEKRYVFDQRARTRAIALASRLFLDDGTLLSINTMPNAIYDPRRCLRSTLAAAKEHGFPIRRLMFEMTEDEEVTDANHLQRIVEYYASSGFVTAIDDFGKRFSNLDLLARFKPHVLKLDRALVMGVEKDPMRRAILRSLAAMAAETGVRAVAEGVETVEELRCLLELGFDHYQGYLFARPAFEALPPVDFDAIATRLAGSHGEAARLVPVEA